MTPDGAGRLVGVRLQRNGLVRYFDAQEMALRTGDRVMVDTPDGPQLGWVVISPDQVFHSDLRRTLRPVLRMAAADDAEGPPS